MVFNDFAGPLHPVEIVEHLQLLVGKVTGMKELAPELDLFPERGHHHRVSKEHIVQG